MITGTHIAYYHICLRKLWLFANGINMEQTSELVSEGKLLHTERYPDRSTKYSEILIGSIKIDFYDPYEKTIHETKKSKSCQAAHEWQLKYYIYILEQTGVEGVKGILEYPLLRLKKTIVLEPEDKLYLQQIETEIPKIIGQNQCPPRIKKGLCAKCAYFDFCWIDE